MGVAKFPILQLLYCKTIRPNLLSSLLIQGACGLHPEGTIGLFNRGLTTAKPSPAIEENPPGDHEDYWKKFNEIEGLGARLSLVVREIENIERKRNTLQQPSTQQEIKEGEGIESAKQPDNENEDEALASPTQVEISHPWPEWIELVDRLVQGNYFTARRSREDDDIDNDISGGAEDFKVLRGLRNACRRFGRERFDILR